MYLHMNIQLICSFNQEYIAIYITKYMNIAEIFLCFFRLPINYSILFFQTLIIYLQVTDQSFCFYTQN